MMMTLALNGQELQPENSVRYIIHNIIVGQKIFYSMILTSFYVCTYYYFACMIYEAIV